MKSHFVKYLCLCLVLTAFMWMAAASGSLPHSDPVPTSQGSSTPIPTPTPITIEETKLAEWENVTVTALSFTQYGSQGGEILVSIKNNGAETVTVSCGSLSVNGCTLEAGGYLASPEPGATATASIVVYYKDLQAAGITTVGQVAIGITLQRGSDLWTADPVSLYTSAWVPALLTPEDSGQELYQGQGLRMVAKPMVSEGNGVSIPLYLENSTGEDIWVEGQFLTVNGQEMEPYLIQFVQAGTYAIGHLYIYNSDLEGAGLEDVREITLSVCVYAPEGHELLLETGELRFSVE